MIKLHQIFIFFILLILSSCQSPASYSNLKLNFDHLKKISINAKDIELVSSYEAPLKRPNIEHLYEETILQLTARYFKYKLVPNGGDKRIKINIKESSLKKNKIKKTPKKFTIENIFNKEPDIVYSVDLKVDIEMRGERGFIEREISTNVFLDKTNIDNLSINEESMLYFEISENLILLLDREVDKQLKKYFQDYIK